LPGGHPRGQVGLTRAPRSQGGRQDRQHGTGSWVVRGGL